MEGDGNLSEETDIQTTVGEEGNEEPTFRLLYDLPDTGEEGKEEVLQQFLKRLKSSEDYMKTLYPSMIANYKKYSSVADPIVDEVGDEITDRANLFLPYPYAIVEAEMPRLAGRLPRAHAFPKVESETAKVDAIQDLIYYSLDRMNFINLQTQFHRVRIKFIRLEKGSRYISYIFFNIYSPHFT